MGDRERRELLGELLKGVSRSFYLTLRVLPRGLREPIGLAYLLARAADTIADTRLLPAERRLEYLLLLRRQVQGEVNMPELQGMNAALTDRQSTPEERELLDSLPQALAMLQACRDVDRDLIRQVVVTLTRGMEMDLTIFPAEDSGRIGALESRAELDNHLYHAAGCVGEFWTEITMAHVRALRRWETQVMREAGVRFGKALQMTNVLRDVPKDLRMGRCYLPKAGLAQTGVEPEELLDPAAGPRVRPVLTGGIEVALGHYAAAEEYLVAIPRRCIRLRLAALWPVIIGLATLAKLANNPMWLDPAHPSRVSRGWVYRMMAFSLAAAASNGVLRAWIRRWRGQVEAGL